MSSYLDINAGHGELYANKLSVDPRSKLVSPSPQPSPTGGEGDKQSSQNMIRRHHADEKAVQRAVKRRLSWRVLLSLPRHIRLGIALPRIYWRAVTIFAPCKSCWA